VSRLASAQEVAKHTNTQAEKVYSIRSICRDQKYQDVICIKVYAYAHTSNKVRMHTQATRCVCTHTGNKVRMYTQATRCVCTHKQQGAYVHTSNKVHMHMQLVIGCQRQRPICVAASGRLACKRPASIYAHRGSLPSCAATLHISTRVASHFCLPLSCHTLLSAFYPASHFNLPGVQPHTLICLLSCLTPSPACCPALHFYLPAVLPHVQTVAGVQKHAVHAQKTCCARSKDGRIRQHCLCMLAVASPLSAAACGLVKAFKQATVRHVLTSAQTHATPPAVQTWGKGFAAGHGQRAFNQHGRPIQQLRLQVLRQRGCWCHLSACSVQALVRPM